MADGDQALAAEPGFHGDPPPGGGSGVITVHRLFDHRPELTEQQSKNLSALMLGPAEMLGGVVKNYWTFARTWIFNEIKSF
jgi:hypothetical protein